MYQRPPRDASLRLWHQDDGERMRGGAVQEVWGDNRWTNKRNRKMSTDNNTYSIDKLTNLPATADITKDIKKILHDARQITAQAINTAMVTAYWLIGRRIVLEEQEGKQRAEYGKRILQNISKDLTEEFGNGFSYANLKNMRQFYMTYPDEKGYTLCSQLPWSHNRLIMRVSNPKERIWYMQETIREQWSVRQLERNINSFYYQRQLDTPVATVDTPNTGKNEVNTRQFVKDPYVLEFLGLPHYPDHKERELEDSLIRHMQNFLLELGRGFSFVKRQYRISTETSHYYIDLVFYNYILKCFVLIDLKADKLTHQDVGQMDMYVRMFDDIKRGADDNPTIGILMCAQKDETVVKYSVLEGSKQIFASKYLPYLPTEEELRRELERN